MTYAPKRSKLLRWQAQKRSVADVQHQSQYFKPVAKTGSPNRELSAIIHFQKGWQHKITNWKHFEEFVQKHGTETQREMAKLWGDHVTQQNISDALIKLGLSRKKRLTDVFNPPCPGTRCSKPGCELGCSKESS